MARTKLTSEQRSQLLLWLAADYDWRLIQQWFEERQWPPISRALVTYYRHSRDMGIDRLREKRRSKALSTGLAIKEERVARLKAHADKLEAIKWTPDKNGRLWNEKAWRETLDDIAAELGDRKTVVEVYDLRKDAEKYGVPLERIEQGISSFEQILMGGQVSSDAGEHTG